MQKSEKQWAEKGETCESGAAESGLSRQTKGQENKGNFGGGCPEGHKIDRYVCAAGLCCGVEGVARRRF